MVKGSGFVALLALLPVALGQLNVVTHLAGKKYFGTATNEFPFGDAPYLAQLNNTHDFGQLTPVRLFPSDVLAIIYDLFYRLTP